MRKEDIFHMRFVYPVAQRESPFLSSAYTVWRSPADMSTLPFEIDSSFSLFSNG